MVNSVLRETINAVRARGISLFIFPCRSPWGFSGQAFASEATRYINVFGEGNNADTAFVIWHEFAHVLGGVSHYSSTPHWLDELRCDRFALKMLHGVLPAKEYERLEELARSHIRPRLQAMIDAGITHHVDIDAADWARCTIPLELRCAILEMYSEYNRSNLHEITRL